MTGKKMIYSCALSILDIAMSNGFSYCIFVVIKRKTKHSATVRCEHFIVSLSWQDFMMLRLNFLHFSNTVAIICDLTTFIKLHANLSILF